MKAWVILPVDCSNLGELARKMFRVEVFFSDDVGGPPPLPRKANFWGARWLEVDLRPANVIEALAELASGQDS